MNTPTKSLEGGIYIDKRVLNHAVFQKPEYFLAWVALLLFANDKARTIRLLGKPVEIKRGQLAWSFASLQRRLVMGRKKFSAFIDFCKDNSMVTVEKFPHGTTITIINYDVYNSAPKGSDEPDGHQNESQTGQPDVATVGKQCSSFGEVPSDSEIQDFCERFTDISRGITRIPEAWWRGWLSMMLAKNSFPTDWKRALKNAFIQDWINDRWGARGNLKTATASHTAGGEHKWERGAVLQMIAMAKTAGEPPEEIARLKNLLNGAV